MAILPYLATVITDNDDHAVSDQAFDMVNWCQTHWPYTYRVTWDYTSNFMFMPPGPWTKPEHRYLGNKWKFRFLFEDDYVLFAITWAKFSESV